MPKPEKQWREKVQGPVASAMHDFEVGAARGSVPLSVYISRVLSKRTLFIAWLVGVPTEEERKRKVEKCQEKETCHTDVLKCTELQIQLPPTDTLSASDVSARFQGPRQGRVVCFTSPISIGDPLSSHLKRLGGPRLGVFVPRALTAWKSEV